MTKIVVFNSEAQKAFGAQLQATLDTIKEEHGIDIELITGEMSDGEMEFTVCAKIPDFLSPEMAELKKKQAQYNLTDEDIETVFPINTELFKLSGHVLNSRKKSCIFIKRVTDGKQFTTDLSSVTNGLALVKKGKEILGDAFNDNYINAEFFDLIDEMMNYGADFITPEMLKTPMKLNGKELLLVGLARKRRKYPMVMQDVKTGEKSVYSEEAIKQYARRNQLFKSA